MKELPLFPLGTVLFPGGVLPLRVFEARYMDMMRDCLKNETAFGVCLITKGNETGAPAEHELIGCQARIDHWDMVQAGVLTIRAVGEQRFRIDTMADHPSGFKVAQIDTIEPEPDQAIPNEFQPCVTMLKRISQDLAEREKDPAKRALDQPYRFDSASWVSNRLCEFLPVEPNLKQALMVTNQPLARLSFVMETLRDRRLI